MALPWGLLPLLQLGASVLLQLASAAVGAAPAANENSAPAASFNLSTTITSHMVLQRAPAKLIFWGWGTPGTSLQLRAGSTAPVAATVDAVGRWRMVLAPQPAGPAFGSGNLSFIGEAAADRIDLTDILVGEVWMCTGQSNMGVSLSGVCTGASGDCAPGHALASWDGSVSDGRPSVPPGRPGPGVGVKKKTSAHTAHQQN